jgi:hypothetical protein
VIQPEPTWQEHQQSGFVCYESYEFLCFFKLSYRRSEALCTGCATCILEERVADEAAARDTLYTTLRYSHPGNLALRSGIADVRRLEGDRMHAPVRARPDASLPRKVEREHMHSGPHLFN